MNRITCPLPLRASWVFILLALSACAGLPVRGMVGGQTIETRVDSEVARYYLANYLAGNHSNPVLDARIDQAYQTINGNVPGRSELKQLGDEFSIDNQASSRIAVVSIKTKDCHFSDRLRDGARWLKLSLLASC